MTEPRFSDPTYDFWLELPYTQYFDQRDQIKVWLEQEATGSVLTLVATHDDIGQPVQVNTDMFCYPTDVGKINIVGETIPLLSLQIFCDEHSPNVCFAVAFSEQQDALLFKMTWK